MGGKALISYGIHPKRIPAKDYFELTSEVITKLSSQYDKFALIPAYRNKVDFGDADILIKISGDNPRETIQKLFSVNPLHNAEVYSFPYKDFQIDLIYVQPEIFDVALTYFSWNDAGNLCGRAFHSLKLKYGHAGLYYYIRQENIDKESTSQHVLREVLLSLDPQEILEFAGFDYQRFVHGFDTLEEMFDWVCCGKYFRPDKFKYENLNNANKTRNRKRPTYQYFLEWLEINKDKYKHFQFDDDKLVYLPMICEKFPKLTDEFKIATELYEREKVVESKFNGKLVNEWTGLDGTALGNKIQKFIHSFGNRNIFKEFIFKNSAEIVKKCFLENIGDNHAK